MRPTVLVQLGLIYGCGPANVTHVLRMRLQLMPVIQIGTLQQFIAVRAQKPKVRVLKQMILDLIGGHYCGIAHRTTVVLRTMYN